MSGKEIKKNSYLASLVHWHFICHILSIFLLYINVFFIFFYYGSNMAQFPLPRLIAIAGLLSPDRPNTSANP